MGLSKKGILGLGSALALSLVGSAAWHPIAKFLDRGDWEVSSNCKAIKAEALKESGAIAFAVGRDGKCGYGYGKASLDEVRLIAVQKCTAEGGTDCRIESVRDATYALSAVCERLLTELGQKPRAIALAADKTGICGAGSDKSTLKEAKAEALAECQSRQGEECKITYTRDGTFEPRAECKELIVKRRNAGHPTTVAVHKFGECLAVSITDPSLKTSIEEQTVEICERRFGTGCRLLAAE